MTRSDGIPKVILQGTVEGSRRRGRPKKRWTDNITEWTDKSFADTQAMAHNWKWRELMRKSVMTRPYGSSRNWGTRARQGKAHHYHIILLPHSWRCVIFLSQLVMSPEALRELGDNEPNVFCTWEFYEYEIQSTPVLRGPQWVSCWPFIHSCIVYPMSTIFFQRSTIVPCRGMYSMGILNFPLHLHSNLLKRLHSNVFAFTDKYGAQNHIQSMATHWFTSTSQVLHDATENNFQEYHPTRNERQHP